MLQAYKKHLTFAAVIVAVAIAGILGIGYVKDVRDSSVYALQVNTIKNASGIEKIEDFHKRLDKLRVFINKNSQHKEDEEFYTLWRDKTKIAGAFIDYLEKRRTDLPHMECATRASLMAAILKSEGYRVRSVDAHYVDEKGILIGHALLDVYNRQTKTWETQDPEYDVYWKNTRTGKRASMLESGADKNILPCNTRGCGWTVKSREGNSAQKLKKLTAYTTAIDYKADERITYYRPEIKPDTRMQRGDKKGTYCDVLEKNCKDGFLVSSKDNLKRIMD